VTDQIETFTESGIQLKSGSELKADIIVTATGLVLEILGGVEVTVDGERVDFSKTLSFKGVMFSDVPNLASVFGYINASWTLKADLICSYVARLIAYMNKKGYAQVTPRNPDGAMKAVPFVEHFSSGYIQRSLEKLPRQGSAKRMIFKIKHIDHLVIRVRDLQAMLDFYTNIIGCSMEKIQDDLGLYQLRAGNSLIDFIPVDGPLGKLGGAAPGSEGRNLDHFCLRIEPFDGEQILEYFRNKRVDPGKIESRYGAEGEGPSIYLTDPEGNIIELKGPPHVVAG
jgi:catechol 2,3-dioxygenase-like lactoylglutathione lyase family enzyme